MKKKLTSFITTYVARKATAIAILGLLTMFGVVAPETATALRDNVIAVL